MNKTVISFLFLILCALLAQAEPQYLNLYLNSADKISIELEDEPILKLSNEHLFIKTNTSEISYPLSNVVKYCFSPTSSVGAVRDVIDSQNELTIHSEGSNLIIEGLNNIELVNLFNVDGMLIETKTPLGNSALIDFSNKKSGVYIIVIGDLTYKYVKK